ncbi:FUSC family protein [Flammeovirga aprica]|uniref:Integral membrane bound transporter domain-containing protein n=1 Tax=Flammeovirga aprica JL-4 TaxID=694437 RepID=A0A7X9P468_9BACT|nr:FUSC family protein [Flammeovirga aprica]NME68487.1 hypothetical protein [Flammeovirga aprica JL-4]
MNKKIETYIYQNVERIHLIRTMLLVGISFILVSVLKIPHGTWVCITAMVLIGPIPEFGGIIHRILQRILGTISGSILGVATLLLFKDNLPIQTFIILGTIPLFGLFVFKKYPYAYLIGVMTLIILLGVNENESIETALWRSGNIIFGGLITLVFALIFPVRGVRELKFEMANALTLISREYKSVVKGERAEENYLLEISKIISSIRKQRKIIEHVKKESSHFKHRSKELEEAIVILRRMSGIIELLNTSTFASEIGNQYISQLYSMHEKHQIFTSHLDNLITQLTEDSFTTPMQENLRLTSTREELENLNENNQDNHTPLSPYSYVWLNYQFGLQVFLLEEKIDILFNRK